MTLLLLLLLHVAIVTESQVTLLLQHAIYNCQRTLNKTLLTSGEVLETT